MSTLSEKSLCTSEDKEAQKRSSETRAIEKEEGQNDKRRNVPFHLLKVIYSPDFRHWPILSLLNPEFTMQIRMVMVYGNWGSRTLIVTRDKNVYTLDYNKDNHLQTGNTHVGFYPKKIEELCGKNIKTFARNSNYVLALTEEGEVYSWNFVDERESFLGLRIPVQLTRPTRVAGLSEKCVVDIACGSHHSLALTSDGEVYVWGDDSYRHVDMCMINVDLPRQVKHELEGKKIVHIACGSKFNMVVTDNGKLYSWGNNEISIDSSPHFITSDNLLFDSVTTFPCDQSEEIHYLFSRGITTVSDKAIAQFGSKTTSNNVWQKCYTYPCEITAFSDKAIVKVACGFEHTLALTDEGKVYAWGKNDKGQVGVNNNLEISAPVMVNVSEMEKVLDIAAYGNLSVAVGSDKTVYVWGDCFGKVYSSREHYGVGNDTIIFGDNLTWKMKPEFEGKKVVSIACGSMFNMVITDEGKLYGWGDNEEGQIADDPIPYFVVSDPQFGGVQALYSYDQSEKKHYMCFHEITVTDGKTIVKVTCGFEHTLALTDEGKLYAWGKNDNGQLGVNERTFFDPIMVNLPEKVIDIAAYGNLSIAIVSNKTVYVWGDCFGQNITAPIPTGFSRIYDALAYSKSYYVMQKPLTVTTTDDYEYVEEASNILKSLEAAFDDLVRLRVTFFLYALCRIMC
ncbi:rcc1 and btb domain-containing protein 1 [Lasius niger]|uniref:Rcc1 and btb domain-containing protein 1 n=1 Tax=Lasius niger TaxID=67767 RepID=A0A0J7NDV5_LASNI|nr:rcc1 and btb domain-containing protein 1 [Lasius niger]